MAEPWQGLTETMTRPRLVLPGADYAPPAGPVHLLHVDESLVVVNKPSGLLCVPGKGSALSDCLIGRLRALFPDILLVHRLDRDTSGVMVFARNRRAQRHLGRQFEKRRVEKTYVARITGRPGLPSGRIDLPMIADLTDRPRQKICLVTGRAAQTAWRVLASDQGSSLVRLHPATGRSHQLRLHMRALGHPILGDPLYATGAAAGAPRLMLHAQSLGLRHPDGGAPCEFSRPAPF